MIKLLSKNLIYVYVLLWMLYFLQHMLMLKGIIAQSLFATVIAISFFAFLKVNVVYKAPVYLKWLNIMLLILTIYGLVLIISGETMHKEYVNSVSKNYFYLQTLFQSILPIYAFYYFALRSQLSSKTINNLFLFILICNILIFYQKHQMTSAHMNRDEITNNIGYFFVPLIMMLYVVTFKAIWKYLFMFISFIFIMMSIKRGAILVGAIAAVSFMSYQMRRVTKKQVIYIVGLSITALYAAYKYIINLYETSSYFRVRIDRTLEGDSSGRDHIFLNLWSYFIDRSTLMEFLFGHGAAGTVREFGRWAHNDWLEFAINQGLLGVMLYWVYWCVFVYEWWNYHGPREYQRALRDCIIVYFLVAIFSMSFNNMPLAASLCIGYCLAMNQRDKYMTDYAH